MNSRSEKHQKLYESLSWGDVLEALHTLGSFTSPYVTRRVNESGELVAHLNSSLEKFHSEGSGLCDQLTQHVHPSYREAMAVWLKETTETLGFTHHHTRQSVSCPFILKSKEVIWFEVRFDQADSLTLIEMSDILFRIRLSARMSGFIGFKHDLANRLFLLKALPGLIGFSDPRELLDDVNQELPRLSAFLDDRLSPQWVDGVDLEYHVSHAELYGAISDDLFHRLKAMPTVTAAFAFELEAGLADTLTQQRMRNCSLLGVEWSITYLAKLIKRGVFVRDPSKPLKLSLSSHIPTQVPEAPCECNALLPDDATLCLTLDLSTLEQISLSECFEMCRQRTHLIPSRSNLADLDPESSVILSAWLESWINASYELMGAVYRVGHHSVQIRF